MKKKKHLSTVQQEKIAQVSLCGNICRVVYCHNKQTVTQGTVYMMLFTSAHSHAYNIVENLSNLDTLRK